MAMTVLPSRERVTEGDEPIPPKRLPRAAAGLAGILAVAAVVGIHLALAWPLKAPIIHPDEMGYLQNAHYLARGGLRPYAGYYPGYSLLLVPLWWLSRDPLTVWRGALWVNAGLAGAGAIVAWRLAARLAPEVSSWWRALAVVVALGYAPLLLYSDLALAETAFAAVFLVVCLLAAGAVDRPTIGRWAALGAASGVLALVHPRGFAVCVAAGLLALAIRRLRPVIGVVVGVVPMLIATRLLVVAIKDPASSYSAYSPGGILTRATTAHGLWSLITEAGGQLFYLSVASAGLVPLGLWLGVKALKRPVNGGRAFAALAFLGVWSVSALFMNLGTRADKLIYGRYNDAAVLPLLILALVEVLGSRRRLRAVGTWVTAGGAALLGSAALVGLGHPGSQLHGPLNPVNILGVQPLVSRLDGRVEVLALLAIGAGAVVVLSAVAYRLQVLAAALVLAAFAWVAFDAQTSYVVPGSKARAAQEIVPQALAAIERSGLAVPCLAWDSTLADDFARYNTQFLLPDQRIVPVTATPCGPLVVSPHADFASTHPGARLVTTDPDAGVSLWALPSPAAYWLAARGWLFPADAPQPLPAAARADQLSLVSAVPAVASGRAASVRIAVHHPPGGEPWPSVQTFPGGKHAVRLFVRWYPDAGGPSVAGLSCPALDPREPTPVSCPTVELPRVALPDSSLVLTVPLIARAANGVALPAGSYTVRVGVYQEQVGVFADAGLHQFTVRVTP